MVMVVVVAVAVGIGSVFDVVVVVNFVDLIVGNVFAVAGMGSVC